MIRTARLIIATVGTAVLFFVGTLPEILNLHNRSMNDTLGLYALAALEIAAFVFFTRSLYLRFTRSQRSGGTVATPGTDSWNQFRIDEKQ